MVDSTLRSDASLPRLLTARAHAATPRRLALDVAGGLAAAGAVLLWQPAGWPALLAAACCFATYGVWAMADRALAARLGMPLPLDLDRPSPTALVAIGAVRAVAAILGTVAAFALVVLVLGVAIGRVKS